MKLCVLTNLGKNTDCYYSFTRGTQLVEAYRSLGVDTFEYGCEYVSDLVKMIQSKKPDLVFSIIYYLKNNQQEPVNTHLILDRMGILCIGSSPQVLDLVMSKSAMKEKWQISGVLTPGYQHVSCDTNGSTTGLDELIRLKTYPYIIKPDSEGNSRGIDATCILDTFSDLMDKIKQMIPDYHSLIVEEYLGGKPDLMEYTVIMVGSEEHAIYLPCEIKVMTPQARRIITTNDKEEHHTKTVPVEGERRNLVIDFSKRAFAAAGIQDYGRLDLLYFGNQFHAIEINGQPMIPDRWFAACAQDGGMNEKQYLAAILLASVNRWKRDKNVSMDLPDDVMEILSNEIRYALN